MKPATMARKALLASLLAGATVASTGCSTGGFSLASMNPFGKPAAAEARPGTLQNVSESIASTAGGTRNQASTLGSTAKSAFGKTKNAITGIFTPEPVSSDIDPTDPLSLANKPKSIGPEVFVANGQLWESTGDFNKAMESYAKALASEPNNAPALTSIARLHFRQGNHQQAAEYFQRAIKQNDSDAGLHNDLGLTLSKLGDHPAAIASLQQALQLAPGTSRYANNLASVQFEAGDAEAAYKVLALNNKPAVANFNMAYLFFKSGQLTEAKHHLTQAISAESEAGADPSIKRAVERSRDMLAQIDASLAPIAQAAPQAKIAGGKLFAEKKTSVQQTAQASDVPANVAPAASLGPAMTGLKPPAETATESPRPIKPTESGPAPAVPFAMPGSFSAP